VILLVIVEFSRAKGTSCLSLNIYFLLVLVVHFIKKLALFVGLGHFIGIQLYQARLSTILKGHFNLILIGFLFARVILMSFCVYFVQFPALIFVVLFLISVIEKGLPCFVLIATYSASEAIFVFRDRHLLFVAGLLF